MCPMEMKFRRLKRPTCARGENRAARGSREFNRSIKRTVVARGEYAPIRPEGIY